MRTLVLQQVVHPFFWREFSLHCNLTVLQLTCVCKSPLSIRKIILANNTHYLRSNDEQVLDGPGLQDFLVKCRGACGGFAPNHIYFQQISEFCQAEEHACSNS